MTFSGLSAFCSSYLDRKYELGNLITLCPGSEMRGNSEQGVFPTNSVPGLAMELQLLLKGGACSGWWDFYDCFQNLPSFTRVKEPSPWSLHLRTPSSKH